MFFVLGILLILNGIYLLGAVLYLTTGLGKRLYHDVMAWHMPTDSHGFDGCSFTSTCKYCGKEIMQDSQGNWF